jgi:hypothetical protein
MIHSADIREWRNHDVVDAKGHKIGVLEAIYVDTSTDDPAMATVRTGMPTRQRLVFVPLTTPGRCCGAPPTASTTCAQSSLARAMSERFHLLVTTGRTAGGTG